MVDGSGGRKRCRLFREIRCSMEVWMKVGSGAYTVMGGSEGRAGWPAMRVGTTGHKEEDGSASGTRGRGVDRGECMGENNVVGGGK